MDELGDKDREEAGDAGVLEYQRALKIRQRAIGGVVMLAWFVLVIGMIFSLPILAALVSMGIEWNSDNLAGVGLLGALPFAWCVTYMTMALLFRRNVRWAGWVAMVMTSITLAGCLVVGVLGIRLELVEGMPTRMWLICVVAGLDLAVATAIGAVVVELWRALRNSAIWVEDDGN